MSDPAQAVVTPMGGRAGVSQQSKIYQFFAQIVDNASVLQIPDTTILQQGWQHDYQPTADQGLAPRDHLCERLWRLGTGSQIVYRSDTANDLNPLSPEEIDSFDAGAPRPGATSATGGSGYFRVRVRASGSRGKYIFFMDVNETIELYAFSAQMELVGPPGAIEITDLNGSSSATPAALQGRVVADARIGGYIYPMEQTTGLNEVTFTQIVNVAQNARTQIQIPRFARSVRIMQDLTAPSSGPWERIVGGTTLQLNVGQINFRARHLEVSDIHLGRESSLLTDSNAAFARVFQLHWTIRP